MVKNDERYERVIDLYLEGTNILDIHKITGVSRPTIYKILDDEEYKAIIDTRLHELQTQGKNRLQNKLGAYISELEKIALSGDSENIRKDALIYLINRILGTPTAKIQDVTDNKEGNTPIEQLEDEFSKFKLLKTEVKATVIKQITDKSE